MITAIVKKTGEEVAVCRNYLNPNWMEFDGDRQWTSEELNFTKCHQGHSSRCNVSFSFLKHIFRNTYLK